MDLPEHYKSWVDFLDDLIKNGFENYETVIIPNLHYNSGNFEYRVIDIKLKALDELLKDRLDYGDNNYWLNRVFHEFIINHVSPQSFMTAHFDKVRNFLLTHSCKKK